MYGPNTIQVEDRGSLITGTLPAPGKCLQISQQVQRYLHPLVLDTPNGWVGGENAVGTGGGCHRYTRSCVLYHEENGFFVYSFLCMEKARLTRRVCYGPAVSRTGGNALYFREDIFPGQIKSSKNHNFPWERVGRVWEEKARVP